MIGYLPCFALLWALTALFRTFFAPFWPIFWPILAYFGAILGHFRPLAFFDHFEPFFVQLYALLVL